MNQKIKMQILEEIKKPNVKGFLIRLIIFAILYAVVFKLHPIFTGRFYGYAFTVFEPYTFYIVFPVLILFTIIKWKQIKEEPKYSNSLWQTLLFSILGIGILSTSIKEILIQTIDIIPNTFTYLFPVYAALTAFFLAIFNFTFVKKFSSELFLVIYLIFLYLAGHVLLDSTWYYFSSIILYSLSSILPIFSNTVSVDPSQLMIGMENFEVNIGATCSGIFSMLTFSFLYVTSVMMIKKKAKIDWLKGIIGFVLGIIALFILNIVRIAIIIAVGAFYSAELAIDLFHEYLSAIFLIGLFLGYLYFVFPRIIKPSQEGEHSA